MNEFKNAEIGTSAAKRKIIVVDDEPFVLKVLARQLSLLGYEVLSFERAKDAVAMLDAGGPEVDVVFTNLQMPEMDGVEFVRHLVGACYGGYIVLVSGEDPRILRSAERLARARGLKVLGALPKPATREQLKEQLSRMQASKGGVPTRRRDTRRMISRRRSTRDSWSTITSPRSSSRPEQSSA